MTVQDQFEYIPDFMLEGLDKAKKELEELINESFPREWDDIVDTFSRQNSSDFSNSRMERNFIWSGLRFWWQEARDEIMEYWIAENHEYEGDGYGTD